MTAIPFDDYNQSIPDDRALAGAVTTTWGHSALRNGWKIIEVCEMRRIPINARADGTAPTITTTYAKGFALSSALYKSAILAEGGGHERLAIIEVYD